MEPEEAEMLSNLPEEMFGIIKEASNGLGPRLGRLSLPGKRPIETPHYLGITSRGVVPHISQDNFREHTNLRGVYVPLEDCKFSTLTRAIAC